MWNSLEVAKLVVSVLTPLAVVLLGLAVTKAGRRAEEAAEDAARLAESAEWANRRAVERLIELHKELAPVLNDLMCFFRLIGHFREIDPPAALMKKRHADKVFYANEHLFGREFRDAYLSFMTACFAHWQGIGQDAKIRSSASRLREERGPHLPWDASWDASFQQLPDSAERRREQKAAYDRAMAAFARELGLARTPPSPAASTRHRPSSTSRQPPVQGVT